MNLSHNFISHNLFLIIVTPYIIIVTYISIYKKYDFILGVSTLTHAIILKILRRNFLLT